MTSDKNCAPIRSRSPRLVMRIESVPPRSEPVAHGNGPDDIILSVDDENGRHELARIDGRYLSTEVATGFTGRMLVIGSCAAEAHVVSVTYRARGGRAPMDEF